MSATPEREQSEAMRANAEHTLEFVTEADANWQGLRHLAGDVVTLAAAVSRLEAERDEARINAIQQAHDASAAMWREQRDRADAAVERAETAEARLLDFVEGRVVEAYCAEIDRLKSQADVAVERERELTRALAATFVAVREHGFCPVCGGNREDGHAHDCKLAEAFSGEALAGGVSAAGQPPEQDLGGNGVAVAEALRSRIARVPEPFLIPDIREPGESPSALFHALRDMVDAGELVHGKDGYHRVARGLEVGAAAVAEAAQTVLVNALKDVRGLVNDALFCLSADRGKRRVDTATDRLFKASAVVEDALTTPTALQQSAPDVALLARLEDAEGEGARLRRTLDQILANALDWHGPEGIDSGHAKALEVIANWARDALAQSEGLPS